MDFKLSTFLLTILPAIINFGIGAYIFLALPRHRTVVLFGLMSFAMAFWQISDFIFISTPFRETALFTDRLLAFSWCFAGPLAVHFSCSYANLAIARHQRIYLIYLPFFVLHCLYVSSPHAEMQHNAEWGWVNGAGTGWVDALALSMLAVCMVPVLLNLFRHAWQMRRVPLRGPQAALVAVGVLVPALAGIVFQVVFPLVLRRHEIPLASELMTFFSMTTIVALVRYRMFDITESITLETVLHQFQSIVFVVLPDGRVQFLNPFTARLFFGESKTRCHLRDCFTGSEVSNAFWQQVIEPVLEGRSLRNNLARFYNGRQPIDALVAAEPIRAGQAVHGVLIVANDITEYLSELEQRQEAEKRLEEEQLRRHHEITEAVISAQEAERRLIGAELHDNINQILTSARLYLDMARGESNNIRFVEQTAEILARAMQEVRKLSHALIPPSLSGETLIEAIRHLFQSSVQSGAFSVQLEVSRFQEKRVSPKLKLTVYRIVQEQWSNIIKYASARQVTVTLRHSTTGLLLTVQDDGVGFNTELRSRGVGLKNIETRALLHGGSVSVQSAPGAGCLLQVEFPLESVAPAKSGTSRKTADDAG